MHPDPIWVSSDPPWICSEFTSLLPVLHVIFKPNLSWDVPVVKLVSFLSPSSFFFTGLLMTVELECMFLSFSSLFFSRLNLMDCFSSVRKTYVSFHSFAIILFSSSWNIYRCAISFLLCLGFESKVKILGPTLFMVQDQSLLCSTPLNVNTNMVCTPYK